MAQQTLNPKQAQQRRQKWIDRVTALADQVAKWSQAKGWNVERYSQSIQERVFGAYSAPALKIHLPNGEILLTPIALRTLGGNGRVDLEGIPTLSRVKLIGDEGRWSIMTDSNVPLRQDWNRKTFTQLVHDLLN
jgi:hypothetical protein